MSRIGLSPISVPGGVKIEITKSNLVIVKGSKGELSQQVDKDILVKHENGSISLDRPTEQKRHKSMHGLYRQLINNMVVGVSEGYKSRLELVGVGYRANMVGKVLELILGYSHPIYFVLPAEVECVTEVVKGQNPAILLNSSDKQLLGQICAKIRALRKIEPYKGKGIKFTGELIRRKAGKASGKK